MGVETIGEDKRSESTLPYGTSVGGHLITNRLGMILVRTDRDFAILLLVFSGFRKV